jgi:hypothetical protein
MTYDQSAATGPRDGVPPRARRAFKVFSALASLGLVAVVALVVDIVVQQHGFQTTANRNKIDATSLASAKAQTFYRDLVANAAAGPLSPSEVQALGLRDRVAATAPVTQGDSLIVKFQAGMIYAEPGYLGGSQEDVELCYIATLPAASGTTAASLRQTVCPSSTS